MRHLAPILEVIAALTLIVKDAVSGKEKRPAQRVSKAWASMQSKITKAAADEKAREKFSE